MSNPQLDNNSIYLTDIILFIVNKILNNNICLLRLKLFTKHNYFSQAFTSSSRSTSSASATLLI